MILYTFFAESYRFLQLFIGHLEAIPVPKARYFGTSVPLPGKDTPDFHNVAR